MTPVWRRLLRLLWPQRAGIGLAVVLQVATVGAGIGLMGTSAWLISKAALHPSIAVLQVAIVGVRFFGIARGGFRYLERLASHEVTLRLLGRLRIRVYRALEPMAPARLLMHRGGDLVARLVGDIDVLENLYVRVLGPTLSAAVVALLVVLLLAPAGWAVAVAAVAGLLVAGVGAPALARRLGGRAGARTIELKARLTADLVDTVQGMGDLLAFGRHTRQRASVHETGALLARAQQRGTAAAAVGTALAGLAADAAGVAVMLLAAAAVHHGILGGVQLAVVVLTTIAAFEAAAPLAAAYQGLGATAAAAGRIFEIADEQPMVSAPEAPPPGKAGLHARARSLEVRGLRFRYPGELEHALDGISLRLGPGRFVAVVGASGAGKSTLAHLLLRFWDAESGEILIDGQDVRATSPEDVRTAFAYVSQPAHLFTGTIRDNLQIASPRAADPELAETLEEAGLAGFVSTLPEGLGTGIGENGVRLSGGERQRLALARALLKDAPFLVLDEPTASVDPAAERDVLGALRRAATNRGVLLITHRLAGLAAADEILVLRNGREIQRGTFAVLAREEGWFRSAIAIQRALMP